MKRNEANGYSLPWEIIPRFDFETLYHYYYRWELSIVMEMLEFEGLPATIEETFLKWCLYVTGKVTFFRGDNGELLALNGVPSNDPDIYYIPKGVIINNPELTASYNLIRDKNCIVVYCTETDKYVYYGQSGYGGIYSLLAKTATMLANNDISINVAQKNTRLHNILSADVENTKNSIDMVFKKMYDGEPYSVVQSNLATTLQSLPLTSSTSNSYIVQLVELHQYILAHFYEALGIQTHDNMKKERLITAELDDNPALLQMNINNIVKSVTAGIEKVNQMFNTSITVKLNPLLNSKSAPLSPTTETREASSQTTADDISDSSLQANLDDMPETYEQPLSDETVETPQQASSDEINSTSQPIIQVNVENEANATIVIEQIGDENNDIPNTSADETILD